MPKFKIFRKKIAANQDLPYVSLSALLSEGNHSKHFQFIKPRI